METQKVTRKEYLTARKAIEKAQNKSTKAMREGNQQILDEAGDEAVKAFAVIAAYKSQH